MRSTCAANPRLVQVETSERRVLEEKSAAAYCRCQNLYSCTSKASKVRVPLDGLSAFGSEYVVAEREAPERAARAASCRVDGQISGTKVLQHLKLVALKY